MLNASNNFLSGNLSFNSLNNLIAKDLGLLSSASFISSINYRRLNEISLSKYRSISPLNHSVTWLNLDNVENRL
jgi:hypothetical protein